jgi:hypothetical protein
MPNEAVSPWCTNTDDEPRSFTSVRSEDDRVGSVQILTYQGFDHRASEASSFLWVELSLVVLMHPGYGRLNSAPEYRRSWPGL